MPFILSRKRIKTEIFIIKKGDHLVAFFDEFYYFNFFLTATSWKASNTSPSKISL